MSDTQIAENRKMNQYVLTSGSTVYGTIDWRLNARKWTAKLTPPASMKVMAINSMTGLL